LNLFPCPPASIESFDATIIITYLCRSRSPRESPKAERLGDTELRIRGLTRNVTAEHIREIMGTFGPLERVDFAVDDKVHLPRGFADISYKSEEHGRLAKEYMHEGQIDGAQVSVIYRRNAGRANTKKLRSRSPMTRRRKSPSPVGRRRKSYSPSPVGRRRRSYSPSVYRSDRGRKKRYSTRSPVSRGRSRSPRRSQSYSRSPYSSRSRSYSSRSPRRSRSYSRSPYSSRSYSSYSSRSYSSRSTSRGRSPPRRR
jgi:RNA-binding protein with serine-rich domain 1